MFDVEEDKRIPAGKEKQGKEGKRERGETKGERERGRGATRLREDRSA